jgi:hypothetical protein
MSYGARTLSVVASVPLPLRGRRAPLCVVPQRPVLPKGTCNAVSQNAADTSAPGVRLASARPPRLLQGRSDQSSPPFRVLNASLPFPRCFVGCGTLPSVTGLTFVKLTVDGFKSKSERVRETAAPAQPLLF